MLRVVLCVVGVLLAFPAFAAEQPAFAPPPAWVKPVEVAAPAIDESGPPLRFLLEDRQLNFGPDGDAEYVRQVAQIRTTAGLSDAGSVTLAWNPDTQAVTVHHLRVLRSGKIIDVLATQSFTVLRREAGLESSILDGALTAAIQPEGLEVGDVLELAYTIKVVDPLMRGRAEHVIGSPLRRLDRYRVRATWDTARAIAWRAGRSLPKPTISKVGNQTQLFVELKDVEALEGPAYAPARFAPSRDLWFSDFGAWEDVAAVMVPLYERASHLSPTSPLRAEVARIRALSDDPKVRGAEALRLVQDRVRYLAVMMSNGGLDPADADATWLRRYGDCKGKTALLIALLRELGIDAEPALASTVRGDGLDAQLPSLGGFDHVLVRAVIGGRTYWLDGARVGDRSLDAIRTPPYQWALPVRAKGSSLVALTQSPLDQPDLGIFIEVDASGGVDAPAPARGRLEIAGDSGLQANLGLATLSAAERDKLLREFWSGASWIEVKTVSAQRDDTAGRTRILMEGVARPNWRLLQDGPRTLEVTEAAFEDGGALKRERGPDTDVPYLVADHPSHIAFNLVMKLPDRGEGFAVDSEDVETRAAGRELIRRARIENGLFTVESRNRTLAGEYPASEAAAAEAAFQKVADAKVVLRASRDYVATEADIAAWLAASPTTVNGYLSRAHRLTLVQRHDAAVTDYDKALALNPKSADVFANRGIALYWGGHYEKAKADFETAAGLDPRNWVALHGRALLALRDRRYEDAVVALSRAADLHPNNVFAFSRRADAYFQLGQLDKALADVDEVLKIEPGNLHHLTTRGEIYARKGDAERAAKDFAAVRDRSAASASRLNHLCWSQATANFHLDRALADCQAALALEPRSAAILDSRAFVLLRLGKLQDAVAGYDEALKLQPRLAPSLYGRGLAWIGLGRAAEGQADLAAARSIAPAVVDAFAGYGLPAPTAGGSVQRMIDQRQP